MLLTPSPLDGERGQYQAASIQHAAEGGQDAQLSEELGRVRMRAAGHRLFAPPAGVFGLPRRTCDE